MKLTNDVTNARWKFEHEQRGSHVHVTVRCGQPGQRHLLGALVMDEQQWTELGTILLRGSLMEDSPDIDI